MSNKKKSGLNNHKVLDQRAAPIISRPDTTVQDDVVLSPEKEVLLNSLLPSEEERSKPGRLNMETERLAPLPEIENIPDVVVSEPGGNDDLVAALQEMAGGVTGEASADMMSEEPVAASGEKDALLDSLLPLDASRSGASRAEGSSILSEPVLESDEPVLSSAKQAMLDSLLPSLNDVKRVDTGRGVATTEALPELVQRLEREHEEEAEPTVSVSQDPVQDKVFAEEFVENSELSVDETGSIPSMDQVQRTLFEVPVQAVRAETIAGLTLWDDGATVCLLKICRGKLEVTHAGHVEFPEKAGDTKRIALIRSMWKRSKIPTRSVWVSVHASSMLQKYVMYDLDGEHLKAALLRDAEQSLRAMGGDSAVDWLVSPRQQGGVEGMVFAVPGWERDHYISLLRKAGLLVCGMSVSACDLARTLEMARPYPELKQRPTECVVSFSRSGADIVIVYGAGSFYSRTVFSRVASWRDNMNYLYECLNDAMGYFSSWINGRPVATLLLTGMVPDLPDLGGELLRETGIFAEIWNPVSESPFVSMASSAKHSGVSGSMLAGTTGLALIRD